MATKAETTLQQNIVRAIRKKYGSRCWVLKVHGGPYQKTGVPDLLVIIDGVALWFEVKMPGEDPTEIQKAVMQEIRAAGCVVAVVESVSEAMATLA